MENSDEVTVESVTAINETTVGVTFGDTADITEEDLTGKELTLTAGENTQTATYVDGSLADGKADFLLSEDSKLVADTTYTVSADWATFENGEFTFTDNSVDIEDQEKVDAAVKAAQDAINALPAKEDITADNYADVQKEIKAAQDLLAAAQELDGNVSFYTYPLEQAREKVAEILAGIQGPIDTAVKAAQDAINALPEMTVNSSTLLEVKKAITDAEKLVADAQALDENVNFDMYPLTTTENKVAALEAAQDAISAIGNPAGFDLTTIEENAAKVQDATDKIAEASKLGIESSDIGNIDHYNVANAKVEELKSKLDEQKLASLEAKTALTNLPLVDSITLKNKEQVDNARKALDAATTFENVTEDDFVNVWKLVEAEEKIENLESTAGSVETDEQLQEVLDNHATEVTLASNFHAPENVTINSTDLEKLELNGTFAKDLTVNAPNADVVNNASVTGTIFIGTPDAPVTFARAMAEEDVVSWTENATTNKISVNKPVTLKVEGNVKKLTLNKPTKLVVADNVELIATVEVNAKSTIVSSKDVKTKVAKDVEVTVKASEDAEGTVLVGVPYTASGKVTVISVDSVKYVDGNFAVPTDVTEFTFKDGDADVEATFADGKWTFKTDATNLEPTIEDKAAAMQAAEAINAIPTNNNPLLNGELLVTAKTTYDALTDAQKALVSEENVNKLTSAVEGYIDLSKSSANAAVTAVTREQDIEKKQEIVNEAQKVLDTAKKLGMETAEYDHNNGFIAEAQKIVDTAKAAQAQAQAEVEKIAKEITSTITVDADTNQLPLPTVKDGYTVAMNTSSDETVITTGGAVTHSDTEEKKVTVTFTVTKDNTNYTATTGDITVTVAQSKDGQAADTVTNLIAGLPEVVTVENKEAIETARTSYTSLIDNQKELVTNLDKLTTAETALEVALQFVDEVNKITLTDSTVREDSFRLGIGWSAVNSEITNKAVNEVFNSFKVTLLDGDKSVIGTLELALDKKPGTDGFINKMNVSAVDATSIRYDSQGVDAKGGVTGWYKSAYVGGKENKPKYAKIEVEDMNGNQASKEVKINE